MKNFQRLSNNQKLIFSGVYSCTASNSQGESKKFFSVDVASAPQSDSKNYKEKFEVNLKEEVTLDCSKVKASPPPNFFWFKNK